MSANIRKFSVKVFVGALLWLLDWAPASAQISMSRTWADLERELFGIDARRLGDLVPNSSWSTMDFLPAEVFGFILEAYRPFVTIGSDIFEITVLSYQMPNYFVPFTAQFGASLFAIQLGLPVGQPPHIVVTNFPGYTNRQALQYVAFSGLVAERARFLVVRSADAFSAGLTCWMTTTVTTGEGRLFVFDDMRRYGWLRIPAPSGGFYDVYILDGPEYHDPLLERQTTMIVSVEESSFFFSSAFGITLLDPTQLFDLSNILIEGRNIKLMAEREISREAALALALEAVRYFRQLQCDGDSSGV